MKKEALLKRLKHISDVYLKKKDFISAGQINRAIDVVEDFDGEIPEQNKEEMNWTEPKDPTEGVSHYSHVISETPLGQCLIEWKGWKQSDSYSVTIGNEYIGEGYDLEDGKRLAKDWLTKKHNELSELFGI